MYTHILISCATSPIYTFYIGPLFHCSVDFPFFRFRGDFECWPCGDGPGDRLVTTAGAPRRDSGGQIDWMLGAIRHRNGNGF